MKDYTQLAKGGKPMYKASTKESAKSSRSSSESSSTGQAESEEKEGFFSKIADSISEGRIQLANATKCLNESRASLGS